MNFLNAAAEKKKRLQVQEDRIEKNSNLMQDLIQRDNKIFRLQNEMLELKSEFNDMNSF